MRRCGNWKWLLCWLFLGGAGLGTLYAQRVWSDVKLDRTSAYVGQPVEVRITVYTSTWFTRGLDLGNIKVNGAFSVYFRPVSQSFQYEGKTYAGVQQIYHVFPYRAEDLVFPSLEITVESPPEGDYKGVSRTIRSEEKAIRVLPPPPNVAGDQWLVATGLQVTENWSGDRRDLKVGDVLERRIRRSASGTVAELIPPIAWDSLPGVGLYPARSSVQNDKSRTAISATRTETVRYLFEQEGEVVLPEMVFTWYNPYRKQLYKRTLPKVTLAVRPNPDLGILASVRDSLAAQQASEVAMEEGEEATKTILGLSVRDFLIALGLLLLALYGLIAGLRGLAQAFRQQQAAYRRSEAYFFRQFERAARKGDQADTVKCLYRWIDELGLAEPSAAYFASAYGPPELAESMAQVTPRGAGRPTIPSMDTRLWKQARQNFLHHRKTGDHLSGNGHWINP